MTFLIQSKKVESYEIPAQDYGYTVMNLIDFQNWINNKTIHSYILTDKIYLNDVKSIIPVGSIEFCLDFYNKIGINDIKPLNIPIELKDFLNRKCYFSYNVYHDKYNFFDKNGEKNHYMIKSNDKIKDEINGIYSNKEINLFNFGILNKYFVSEYIPDIISEWRLFVYNKKIVGLKCYSGDEWALPDKNYCESIVEFYDKKSYTLDVMVDKDLKTDIIELHDFFACGLYGFDHPKLLNMMITAHREILNRLEK